MKKTLWSPEAAEDLRTIYRFYLHDNPQFAVSIYRQIKDEAKILKKHPAIGSIETILEKYNKIYRSLLIRRMFKIIYYINNDQIIIVAVWGCRRNPEILKGNIDQFL